MTASAARAARPDPARKVLIVGPSWVGDMVMAQAAYRLLAERHPGVRIHVVGPRWSLPVLERMAEVEHRIELDVAHGELGLAKRRSLGRALRAEGYDRALVLPRSAKAALVPWFARVPRRTGFRGEWRYGLLNDVRPFDTGVLDQTVKRFAALALEPGEPLPLELPAPRLAADDRNAERLRQKFELGGGELIAFMPGAEYGPAKRWPVEHFAALAARLAARRDTRIVLLGSAKERPLGEELGARSGAHVRNLCGETALTDVIDLLAAARVAVTNDSGLMHVAAAVGTHVVAIYGSSSPGFTPPLTASKTIVYRQLECSPCFARDCPLGHLKCLRELPVETVLAAVEAAKGGPPERSPARMRADG